MQLIVNGEKIEYGGKPFLAEFVRWWLKTEVKVATVVNGEVIAESERPKHRLNDNDRVEFVTFAGGG
jgi:thiamine biosynthesis protein ThiS